MNAPPDEEVYDLPPDPRGQAEADLAFTRMMARLWVWLCPGTGYAGTGLPVLALTSFASWFVFYAALAWFLFTVNPAAVWIIWLSCAIGVFLWLVEIVLVWFPTSRRPAPRFLTRLPIVAIVAIWTLSFAGAGLFVVKMGSAIFRGNEMSPAVNDREQVFYLKQVEPTELKRGTVILFRTSLDAGPQNTNTFGRIAAVPGDRIAMSGGRLINNGEPGPMLGTPTDRLPQVIAVPRRRPQSSCRRTATSSARTIRIWASIAASWAGPNATRSSARESCTFVAISSSTAWSSPMWVGSLAPRVAYPNPAALNISMLASNAATVWSITASVCSHVVIPAKPHQSTPFKSIAWRRA